MLDELQRLDPPFWVVIVLALLVVTLVAYDVVLGKADYRRFAEQTASAEPAQVPFVRARFLWKWAWQPWVLTIIALVFVLLAPGIKLTDLGLVPPDFSVFGELIGEGGISGGTVLGALTGMGLTLGLGVIIGVRRRARDAQTEEGTRPVPAAVNQQVDAMLPSRKEDRRAWVALSATAGITEEIMYRGFILLAFATLLPSAPNTLIYAVTVAAFAAAHAYQGWSGVLSTGILSAVFVALYASTGSLLLGMLLHFLVDLRGVFVNPGRSRTP